MKPSVAIGIFTAFLIVSCHRAPKTATINNTSARRDVSGQIIDAHDGCLQFFDVRFYLYGTAYGTNTGYTTANRYRVYSSIDLQHWELAGDLLTQQWPGVYYRPYVVFNPNTRKYVLWYNWYPELWDGQAGVAVSDTPTGPFTIKNTNAKLACTNPGDGSLFVDDDGTGYYIYTALDDHYSVHIEKLTPDYTAGTGETIVLATELESPVLFKRENIYYAILGRRCAFCPKGSDLVVCTSISPLGPYSLAQNLNLRDGTTNEVVIPGQQTWIAKIPTDRGPEFIWMADFWQSAPDGIKGHDLQFWARLNFDRRSKMISIENSNQWSTTVSW